MSRQTSCSSILVDNLWSMNHPRCMCLSLFCRGSHECKSTPFYPLFDYSVQDDSCIYPRLIDPVLLGEISPLVHFCSPSLVRLRLFSVLPRKDFFLYVDGPEGPSSFTEVDSSSFSRPVPFVTPLPPLRPAVRHVPTLRFPP